MWSVLAGAVTDSASSIVIHDVKEIETWILRLLSAPVPIPNSTRIEVDACGVNFRSHFLFIQKRPSRLKFSVQRCILPFSLHYQIIHDLHLLIIHFICLWNCWVCGFHVTLLTYLMFQ